jgi:iron complex outermembrane recepter protein
VGTQAILDACILGGASAQCRLITRLPGTGAVTGVLDINTNGASDDITGYDLTANYRFETENYGKFRATIDTTYLDEYINITESGLPGDPLRYSLAGNYYGRGTLAARLKSNASLTWDYNEWGASWAVRYVSRLEENCSNAVDVTTQCSDLDPNGVGLPFNVDGLASNGLELVPINSLGGTTYHDLQVRWKAPWNATLSGGIRNIFDKNPPISISVSNNSFDPSYDLPGRFYYLSYNQKF